MTVERTSIYSLSFSMTDDSVCSCCEPHLHFEWQMCLCTLPNKISYTSESSLLFLVCICSILLDTHNTAAVKLSLRVQTLKTAFKVLVLALVEKLPLKRKGLETHGTSAVTSVLLSVWGSVLARPGCSPQTDLLAWTRESVLWESSPWSEQVHVAAEICQRSRGHRNHGRARRRNRTAVCSFGWAWCGAEEEQAPSSDAPYTSPVFNNQNTNVHLCTYISINFSKHLRYCLSLYSYHFDTTILHTITKTF